MICKGKMHLSLVTIQAYQRTWYQNIDFEFFPSLYNFFQICYFECQYSWLSSRFIENISTFSWIFFLDQNITFSNYAQGTALPKNTKKSGEVLKYNVSMKNGSPQYQHNLASQPLSSRELGIAQPIWQCMLSPFMIYECLSIHPWLLTNIAGE